MSRLKNFWGLYLLAVFFALGIAGALIFEKGEAELWLNNHWHPAADFFFKYFTYLGNGIAFVFLIIFLLFIRYYYVILTLVVIIIQTLVVQGMKMQIFPGLDRPPFYFRDLPGLHFVEGVELHFNQTFPSGHSATIFAMATILSIAVTKKKLTAVWYLVAILVGISRVYLMQHFFIDIFIGAIIGIGVVCLFHWLLQKTSLKSSVLLNKSIR